MGSCTPKYSFHYEQHHFPGCTSDVFYLGLLTPCTLWGLGQELSYRAHRQEYRIGEYSTGRFRIRGTGTGFTQTVPDGMGEAL